MSCPGMQSWDLGRGPCMVRSYASWLMVTSDHPPLVDRMMDRHDWKQYLPATSLAGGKFCFFEPVTFVLKLDLDMVKMYWKAKTSLYIVLINKNKGFQWNYVKGLRLLLYRKNTWLRTMCCLQIIWRENRKSQQRSWSAVIPRGEDMVQAGCD